MPVSREGSGLSATYPAVVTFYQAGDNEMQSPKQPQGKTDTLVRNVKIVFVTLWAFWLLTMLVLWVTHLVGKPVIDGQTVGNLIFTAVSSACPLVMIHGLCYCLLMVRRWYLNRD